MRRTALLFGLFESLLFLFPAPVSSETTLDSAKVFVKFAFIPREVRDYKIDAVITSRVSGSDSEPDKPTDLKASFHLVVRHRYGRREADGLLPVEISLLKGNASADGSTLELAPSLYPRLTVLIDREWQITDIFGMPKERMAETLPGINYANHIILFYLPGAGEARSPGEKWSYTLKIPALSESYEFTNQVLREEIIDGIRAVVIRQEIARKSYPVQEDARKANFKGVAESAFAVNNGRLLKSHVECEISVLAADSASESKKTHANSALSQAAVKIDISPVESSNSQ